MESHLVEEEVLSRQSKITAEKGVFLIVPMESLLVEEEVLSRQTGIKAEKGHHFWYDR